MMTSPPNRRPAAVGSLFLIAVSAQVVEKICAVPLQSSHLTTCKTAKRSRLSQLKREKLKHVRHQRYQRGLIGARLEGVKQSCMDYWLTHEDYS